MNSWKKIAESLTEDFMEWGCRFSRKQLPEIAMSYECTPLFFWNWQDGETDRSEKGFLRVLGYAWRKIMEEEDEPAPQTAGLSAENRAEPGEMIAACFRLKRRKSNDLHLYSSGLLLCF